MYFVLEDGSAFINMTCVMPKYRRNGFGPEIGFYIGKEVVKDVRVTNKKEAYSEARLEMVKFWKGKFGDKLRFVGP